MDTILFLIVDDVAIVSRDRFEIAQPGWISNYGYIRQFSVIIRYTIAQSQDIKILRNAERIISDRTAPPLYPHGGALVNRVLILTPVKDAIGGVPDYCDRLRSLTYPRELLSVGCLEGDSSDDTWPQLQEAIPALERDGFGRTTLLKRDFGYIIPAGAPRSAPSIQPERRSILARSRNHLLLGTLRDEEWVLWLDVDVIEYPRDIIERLLRLDKDILHPHCVIDYGGATFDLNAWRDRGRLHMDDLRSEGDLVELDAVGASMLLIRADLHRDGLIFPPFPYGVGHPVSREDQGEIESEGLGIMALDMGHRCWGLPNLEIRHGRW
jgi:hypothetical protein